MIVFNWIMWFKDYLHSDSILQLIVADSSSFMTNELWQFKNQTKCFVLEKCCFKIITFVNREVITSWILHNFQVHLYEYEIIFMYSIQARCNLVWKFPKIYYHSLMFTLKFKEFEIFVCSIQITFQLDIETKWFVKLFYDQGSFLHLSQWFLQKYAFCTQV